MRRISKDNFRIYGKTIGKLSHGNPIPTFSVIIEQIISYDNLVLPVVDALKYLSELSFDVILWKIIGTLSDQRKERLKADGTNLSSWVQSKK